VYRVVKERDILPGTNELKEVARLRLPPGKYWVVSTAHLFQRSGRGEATCFLTPSNEDGTPKTPGAKGHDFDAAALASFSDGFAYEGSFTMSVVQKLKASGDVVLYCRAAPPGGAFVDSIDITAMTVGEISEEELVSNPPSCPCGP
jgi:hypothetical protein